MWNYKYFTGWGGGEGGVDERLDIVMGIPQLDCHKAE